MFRKKEPCTVSTLLSGNRLVYKKEFNPLGYVMRMKGQIPQLLDPISEVDLQIRYITPIHAHIINHGKYLSYQDELGNPVEEPIVLDEYVSEFDAYFDPYTRKLRSIVSSTADTLLHISYNGRQMNEIRVPDKTFKATYDVSGNLHSILRPSEGVTEDSLGITFSYNANKGRFSYEPVDSWWVDYSFTMAEMIGWVDIQPDRERTMAIGVGYGGYYSNGYNYVDHEFDQEGKLIKWKHVQHQGEFESALGNSWSCKVVNQKSN